MMIFQAVLCVGLLIEAVGAAPPDGDTVIIVVGAPGTEEYGDQFQEWAERWEAVAKQASARIARIGAPAPDESSDQEQLGRAIGEFVKNPQGSLWIVLLGHGTFDGEEAKFNLRGPDLSAAQLAKWLEPSAAPVAIVDCASCSGPFVNQLSRANRIIVTATKNGYEHNYARFGRFLSEAIADPSADLDKDGQTSLLEAFLSASHGVESFYQQEARLATEHALLDDNGDGLGTPAAWFRGLRATRAAKQGSELDGLRAHQFHLLRSNAEQNLPPEMIAKRNALELEIARLRNRKTQLSEDEYFRELELVMLQLAKLYEEGVEKNVP